MNFRSKIFILPGLNNSGERHWQTLWEKKYPEFIRIQQRDWDAPVCSDWIQTLDEAISPFAAENVILIGHSLGCATIGYWCQQYKKKVKGALLVAPSDTEAASYPHGTTGFKPMPIQKFPFRSFTVTSNNDFYVTPERAQYFADSWGSELINIGDAGHINAASSLADWPFGIGLLKQLDR
jgi:uncharacterized protein